MKNLLDVSIIIVNYNTKELTRNCLKSVFEQTSGISFEVIVSDNGSKDGSIEMIKSDFPQVVLIENNANLGFGAANNRGLKIAKGKYVFYLNSDTVLLNNAVKFFFDYWENSLEKDRIGALGCNLIEKNGETSVSELPFPFPKKSARALLFCIVKSMVSKDIWHKFKKCNINTKNNRSVEAIIGADLFLKNDNNAKFNELFFLYCEEVELQYRLFLQDKKRIIIDEPRIIHLEGASDCKIGLERFYSFKKKRNVREWQSRLVFFSLHFKYSFFTLIFKILLFFIYILPWNCGKNFCNFKAVFFRNRI